MNRITLDWYRYDPATLKAEQGVLGVVWPSVPRVGEYVAVHPQGDAYTVHRVQWNKDGSAVVQLR